MEKESISGPTSLCLNCDAELFGSFCENCGQSSSIQRYDLKTIGHEIYEQFRKIDAMTTLRTFWQLTTRPGEFVSSYLAGRRTGYLAPIKYFFYSFVVQVLVGGWLFWLTNDRSFESLRTVDFRVEVISFVSTAFWGGLWYLFYRRSNLNIVECIVAAVFFVAQVNFFAIIVQLITFPLIKAVPGVENMLQIIEFAIPLGYSFFFVRQLFDDKVLVLIVKQTVLSLLFIALVFLVFVIVYGLEIVMRLSHQ